jgi:hypothetical protein
MALATDKISEIVFNYLVLHFIDISASNQVVFEHLKFITKSVMQINLNTDVVFQLGRFLLERGHLLGLRALAEASYLRGEAVELDMLPTATAVSCANLKKQTYFLE